jgi:uncharacterized membrane protein YkvA (DUF1232 family)
MGRDDRRGISRGRRTTGGAIRRLVGLLAFLPIASRAPIYGRLIFELLRDERTPAERKVVLAAAAGYLVLARDLIPDDLPLVGGLDDLVVVVLAVELFLDGVPSALLTEKLGELGIDRAAFDEDIGRIRRLTPAPVRRTIRRVPALAEFAMGALRRVGVAPGAGQ